MSCPICKKEAVIKYRPFCSKHCADVDLGRWFSGSYAVPAVTDDDMNEIAAALGKASENLH